MGEPFSCHSEKPSTHDSTFEKKLCLGFVTSLQRLDLISPGFRGRVFVIRLIFFGRITFRLDWLIHIQERGFEPCCVRFIHAEPFLFCFVFVSRGCESYCNFTAFDLGFESCCVHFFTRNFTSFASQGLESVATSLIFGSRFESCCSHSFTCKFLFPPRSQGRRVLLCSFITRNVLLILWSWIFTHHASWPSRTSISSRTSSEG